VVNRTRKGESILNRTIGLLGLISLLLLPSTGFGGFRCKPNAIVNVGDTNTEVEILCGAPMSAHYGGEIEIDAKKVIVDRWTYNPGWGKFYVILDFHNGVLSKISHGPRVK
jgi:hypothetical protein